MGCKFVISNCDWRGSGCGFMISDCDRRGRGSLGCGFVTSDCDQRGSLGCGSRLYIHHLHLEDNNFSGSIPNEFFNISELLLTLDVSDNRLSGSIPSAIANAASSLRILSLRGYCLSGTFPTQFIIDLSRNFFSGIIPRRFQYLATAFTPFDLAFSTQTGGSDNGQSEEYVEQDEVNIVTKYRNSSYTGNILNYMSGLDLSCNNLTGAIPLELGQLQEIHALNLSHNQLTGSIPNCISTKDSPPTPTQSSYVSDEKWHKVDQAAFFTSFLVTYIIFFLGVITILYINPRWQLWCYNLVEDCMYSCYFSFAFICLCIISYGCFLNIWQLLL
ncbi:receptor-like protein 1 [Quercus suber]|uniref:Receptor-like protein 1 n=1 Tax=Quercus suber TaxID=58331 RepID=A0AAW0KW09_QUESU